MDEADKPERRGHFRGAARRGRPVDLEYRAEGGAPVSSTTRNIGIGGAFIATPSPPAQGTRLRVTIRPADGAHPLEVDAVVRWVKGESEDGDEPGMGVEFCDLEPDAVVKLSDFFASLVAADTEL